MAESSSSEVMYLGVELLAVGLLALLAGASDDAGQIVVLFMIGLWLLWMISTPQAIGKIGNIFANVATNSNT